MHNIVVILSVCTLSCLHFTVSASDCIFISILNPLDVELIWHAPSVECALPVYRLTASKWITFIKNENDEFIIFLHFYVYLMASHHCPLRHPAPSFGHCYTGYIFDPGPSNPTTFLGLCSPCDYRQSIESPMGVPTFNSIEKPHLHSLFMIVF